MSLIESSQVSHAAQPAAANPSQIKYRSALCLYPYVRESSAAMGFFPPTGLEYIAAALEGFVGRVMLVDLRVEQELADLGRLRQYVSDNADLVCVSMNWVFQVDQVCEVINTLPGDIDVIVGGQYASDHIEQLFARCPSIKIIVRGEGEETIRQIVQDLELENILGISYRRNGSIVHNPNRPLPPVEQLPFPNRALRRRPYYPRWRGVRMYSKRFDTVLTARGCPYNCKFCTLSVNPLGQKRTWSARSPESVVEEIATVEAEVVFFVDDNLVVEPRRIGRICDLLLERGIRKHYIAQVRLEIYKYPELLAKMAAAGFKFFLIGVESPTDRILKQMSKGFDTAEVRQAFSVLRGYPFFYHCYFIFGNIGESEEEMLQIPRFAREIGAHSISFQQLQARTFSPIIEQVANTPGYYLSENGHVYSQQIPRERMRRIKKLIRRRFYTPLQFLRMGLTMRRLKFAGSRELLFLVPRVPALMRR